MRNDSEDLIIVLDKMTDSLDKFIEDIGDEPYKLQVVFDGMLAPIFRYLLFYKGDFFDDNYDVIDFVNNNLTKTIRFMENEDEIV
jgi:hypothetical protein|tara:strand:+ start:4199 stop:4453 length:255 start_codon:yes stop_codon:yes gene_type:complete